MHLSAGMSLVVPLLMTLAITLGGFSACQAQTLADARGQAQARETGQVQGTYTLPPEKLERAIAYSRARITLQFVEEGWSALVLLLLLTTGSAAWMQQKAIGMSKNRWGQGALFVLLFLVVTTLWGLPLGIYRHHLAVAYGQSVQQWLSWFEDQAKSFGLAYVFGVLLVMLLFWVIHLSPRRWWLWFWIPAVLISVVGLFLWPIFIDPMFNKFEPLEQSNPELVQQLERVVARGGIEIPAKRMFLMKASAKVTGLNAYVTGFGASKRVVVWDTSVQKATPDQISFIFGHEMGHYVLNHIYIGLAFSAVLMLVSFWLGYHGMQWLLRRFGARWGITGQGDWAALVVLILVISVISFVAEPVTNSFSRWEEHAADVYGQEAMHGILANPRRTGAETFQLLGQESLTDPSPNPLVEFWTFSHSSVSRRMAFAATYDPWSGGKSPKYFGK